MASGSSTLRSGPLRPPPARRFGDRAALLGVFILLFAIGLGATAGLLPNFQTLAPPSSGRAPLSASVLLWCFVALLIGLVGIAAILVLLRGKRGVGAGINAGASLSLLTLALTCVIVIGVLTLGLELESSQLPSSHSFNQTNGTGAPGSPGSPGGGSPSGPGGGNLSNKTGHTTSGGSPPPAIPVVTVTTVIGIIAALLVVPLAALLLSRPRTERWGFEPPPAEVLRELEAAVAALKAGSAQDARDRIIRAYGVLLKDLRARKMPDLDISTPQEIEALMARRLLLSSTASTALRRVFEEARYSSHEMGPVQASEAVASLEKVLEEIRLATEAALREAASELSPSDRPPERGIA